MTFERRLRSYSIDTSFAFILMVGIGMMIYEIKTPTNTWKYLIVIGLYLAVYIIPNLISPGQTFGKRTQKIRTVKNYKEIIKENYEIPSRFILVLRELTKAVLTIFTGGFYIIVAGIVSTGRQDGRTIHDFIFNTRVIALTRTTLDKTERYVSPEMKNTLRGSGYND